LEKPEVSPDLPQKAPPEPDAAIVLFGSASGTPKYSIERWLPHPETIEGRCFDRKKDQLSQQAEAEHAFVVQMSAEIEKAGTLGQALHLFQPALCTLVKGRSDS
jgi:hypothetical protein